MRRQDQELVRIQHERWQQAYEAHPQLYGNQPSAPALYAAEVFRSAGAHDVLELGAGQGRDSLHFVRLGFAVQAADFSDTGLEQLRDRAAAEGVEAPSTVVVDVRGPLPQADASVDAVFAHMLLCMALSTNEIHALVSEVRRVLRPHGTFVYTVRHTGDPYYGVGIAHGDDIFEHNGFAVHFFYRYLVVDLAEGWHLRDIRAFEEGELPRRLWRITQRLTS
ncbi:MAG: 6-O-methylguanine methyltransferase [Nocardia sp.]|uniref:class I SAM-dependent methyltransferase n=1 Tax=Nocardia sp. TaxID=1821 RepID=UPI002602F99C|nr:class I SAM-dependent methyltransferase [Nocardia sp.]MCU1641326.1 6-O-methylguanine methyltransferase [Nocardia sp.]